MSDTVSADPDGMATFTKLVVPYDDQLGKVVVTQLVPALEHLRQTKPDPAFLPSSVLGDNIALDLQYYAIDCHDGDVIPNRVGQAFLQAERNHPGLPVEAKDIDAQLAKWRLEDNLVPGSGADWYWAVGGNGCAVRGGGFIRGPDGQLYAIVTTDTSPLPASDGHPVVDQAGPLPHDGTVWQPVDQKTDFMVLGDPNPTSVKAAAVWVGTMYPEYLPKVEAVGKNGYQFPMGPSGPDPKGKGVPFGYEPKPDDGKPPENWKVAGLNGISYVDGALAGAQFAKSMDNTRIWNYRVVFYEGPGGARRAQIEMYQLLKAKDDGYYRMSGTGSLGPDGKIVVGSLSTRKLEE